MIAFLLACAMPEPVPMEAPQAAWSTADGHVKCVGADLVYVWTDLVYCYWECAEWEGRIDGLRALIEHDGAEWSTTNVKTYPGDCGSWW